MDHNTQITKEGRIARPGGEIFIEVGERVRSGTDAIDMDCTVFPAKVADLTERLGVRVACVVGTGVVWIEMLACAGAVAIWWDWFFVDVVC